MLLHELCNHYFILRVLSRCVENFRKICNGSGHWVISRIVLRWKYSNSLIFFQAVLDINIKTLQLKGKPQNVTEIFMVKDIRNKFFRLSGFDTGCLEADEDINSSRRIRYTGLAVEYCYKIITKTGFLDLIGVASRMIS